jgi:IS5 family transposase
MTRIKRKDRGLFEYQERIEKLNNIKTPMDKLNQVADWELFRPTLDESLAPREQKAPGGASHYDYVFMFKILVIQRYYNLSDEQTEFRINDSLSLQRFLGITLSDKVPDHNKIWEFRERLTKTKTIEKLFKLFDQMLESQGIVGKAGVIVDASFVDVPKQRNHREENKKIKEGEIPEDWKENPHKLSHKDTDARWVTKNTEKHYGYKNHAKVDVKSKFVREYAVTDASVHDSQVVEPLLNDGDKGKPFYADSAYVGPTVAGILGKFGMKNRIHEKGYRNKPLMEKQKSKNKRKSRVRVRVEHVFGFVENSMNGSTIRSIGKERAEGQIGLMNLVYNLARYVVVKNHKAAFCAA